MSAYRFGCLILAAGASARMGRPKLLLPWGSKTILSHLVAEWRQAGAEPVVVTYAAGNKAIVAEINRIGIPERERVENPDPARGMFNSIQCGARWNGWPAELSHVAVVLGDQPQLAGRILRALSAFAAREPGRICQPSRGRQPRHPVFLPLPIFRQAAESNDATLAELLKGHADRVRLLECDDDGLDLDIDTMEDYERARQFYFGLPPS